MISIQGTRIAEQYIAGYKKEKEITNQWTLVVYSLYKNEFRFTYSTKEECDRTYNNLDQFLKLNKLCCDDM
jgi:hypothetical protein